MSRGQAALWTAGVMGTIVALAGGAVWMIENHVQWFKAALAGAFFALIAIAVYINLREGDGRG